MSRTKAHQAPRHAPPPAGGSGAAEKGAANGDAGQQTAEEAPVNETAPEGTPADDRAPGRG